MGCSESKSTDITVLPKGAVPEKAPSDYRKKNQYPIPVVLPPSQDGIEDVTKADSSKTNGASSSDVPKITIEEPTENKTVDVEEIGEGKEDIQPSTTRSLVTDAVAEAEEQSNTEERSGRGMVKEVMEQVEEIATSNPQQEETVNTSNSEEVVRDTVEEIPMARSGFFTNRSSEAETVIMQSEANEETSKFSENIEDGSPSSDAPEASTQQKTHEVLNSEKEIEYKSESTQKSEECVFATRTLKQDQEEPADINVVEAEERTSNIGAVTQEVNTIEATISIEQKIIIGEKHDEELSSGIKSETEDVKLQNENEAVTKEVNAISIEEETPKVQQEEADEVKPQETTVEQKQELLNGIKSETEDVKLQNENEAVAEEVNTISIQEETPKVKQGETGEVKPEETTVEEQLLNGIKSETEGVKPQNENEDINNSQEEKTTEEIKNDDISDFKADANAEVNGNDIDENKTRTNEENKQKIAEEEANSILNGDQTLGNKEETTHNKNEGNHGEITENVTKTEHKKTSNECNDVENTANQ